ncbi:hypothetical protein THAOC_29844, partial [Thalassiosira oceanica]
MAKCMPSKSNKIMYVYRNAGEVGLMFLPTHPHQYCI